jgi:hypothetical protein
MLSGHKTCTRRYWDKNYATRFSEGDLIAAYNRSPRARGVEVATLVLTETPRRECLRDMPDEDYAEEGFEWMAAHPISVPKTLDGAPFDHDSLGLESFRRWQSSDDAMWVIRFIVVAFNGPNIQTHVKPDLKALIADSLNERLRTLWEAQVATAGLPT